MPGGGRIGDAAASDRLLSLVMARCRDTDFSESAQLLSPAAALSGFLFAPSVSVWWT